MSPDQAMLNKALAWIRDRQLLDPQGDWRVYCPHLAPGGFSFEYANSVYPDVDDTAAIILAQVKHDPSSIDSDSVIAAVTWILGMQSSDGGWAAFDVDNNKLFLNRIPFSDMDSLCDTSSVDIIGRILEAFGLILKISSSHDYRMRCLFPQLRGACDRAIQYIVSNRRRTGPSSDDGDATTSMALATPFAAWHIIFTMSACGIPCNLRYSG